MNAVLLNYHPLVYTMMSKTQRVFGPYSGYGRFSHPLEFFTVSYGGATCQDKKSLFPFICLQPQNLKQLRNLIRKTEPHEHKYSDAAVTLL